MQESSLYEFCLVFCIDELEISEALSAFCPEGTDVTVIGLDLIEPSPCLFVFQFLIVRQKLKST